MPPPHISHKRVENVGMRSLPIDVVAGPRAVILDRIQECPGIHLRQIERDTSLALGQVLYHLDRLERMGVVVSTREGGFRRFFRSHDVARGEKPYVAALRQPLPRRIQLALLERGALTHKDLQLRMEVAASTLSFHLQRLVGAGVLIRERVGTQNLYTLADADATRRAVVLFRESFKDPEVDRFVRALLDSLPPLASARVELVSS